MSDTAPSISLTDFGADHQWVAWRNEMRNGKPDKIPYFTAQRRAEADNPTTWLRRTEAEAVRDAIVNGGGGGIGIELGECGQHWLCGIDLDRCRGLASEVIAPWAVQVIERINSYTETSPSGTGVKVYFLVEPADVPELRRLMGREHGRQFKRTNGGNHPPAIELYVSNRYFAVTWEHLPASPTELRTVPLSDLRWLIETAGPCFAGKAKAQGSGDGNGNGHADNSRSAIAFRKAKELRRAGKTFEEMVEALRADPETSAWTAEKGEASDQRELHRMWDKVQADADTAGAEAEIARLAKLSALQYAQQRGAAAKLLGMPPGSLDKLVRAERGASDDRQGRPLELPVPEPWPEPVEGVALLGALAKHFSAHAFLPEGAATVLALWTVHTYAFELFRHTPRLHVKAIAKNSGKTTLLDLLELVSCRALPAANASGPVLFRAIEMAKPTLLIDEADTFLDENEGVRGVLNAGHKCGGQVLRTVGEDFEPRVFSVFAPVAIAGIGSLPGTIADRAIAIPMKRALRAELPKPITDATRTEAAGLARCAVRWALDREAELAEASPAMGDMFNRLADNWRPLYAIANLAGGDWPERARRAAAALAVTEDDAETIGVKLLADIRDVFSAHGKGEIPSKDLVDKLVDLEGRPWAEFGRTGKPLTQNRLARLLKPFAIIPGKIGPDDARQNGYQLPRFLDAFARHLREEPL